MKHPRRFVAPLLATLLGAVILGPNIAHSDPPDKEWRESEKEQQKWQQEQRKREQERSQEERKFQAEMERERRNHEQQAKRERGKAWLEDERERRKWQEAMERERRQQRQEMDREARQAWQQAQDARWQAEMRRRQYADRNNDYDAADRLEWELESYRDQKLRQLGKQGLDILYDEIANELML